MIADPRFFKRIGPCSLALIVETARGSAPNVDLLLAGVAPLQTAASNEMSFLDNRRYVSALEKTLAGAVIVHPDMLQRVPAGTVPIVTTEPYAGWAGRRAVSSDAYGSPGRSSIRVHCRWRLCRSLCGSRSIRPCRSRAQKSAPVAELALTPLSDRGVVLGPECRIGAHASLSHAF